ncbi:MAG: hypothetical protein GY737_17010 [Desulfobacteraceae bacterium]|nr:hypothetical protein [Desulfobacteraceae bacterium]
MNERTAGNIRYKAYVAAIPGDYIAVGWYPEGCRGKAEICATRFSPIDYNFYDEQDFPTNYYYGSGVYSKIRGLDLAERRVWIVKQKSSVPVPLGRTSFKREYYRQVMKMGDDSKRGDSLRVFASSAAREYSRFCANLNDVVDELRSNPYFNTFPVCL